MRGAAGRDGLLRGARGRDGQALGRGRVLAMEDDLRRRLTARFGTSDLGAVDRAARRPGPISVPVRIHVLTSGRDGAVSEAVLRRQVGALNAAYGGRDGGHATGVRFRLVSTDRTNRPQWFHEPERLERQFKRALRRGGAGTLNLYTASVGSDVLGFSTFPQAYRKKPVLDGVVVDYRTLPGGSFRHFAAGKTAVHETGHWLGLYHTFENGCEQPGDEVGDTPFEAEPSEGCPVAKDTCPQPGGDPVHNFMDYGWDECMHEFTAGQGRRVRAVWAAYRERAGGPDRGHGARSVGGAR
ncbi:zinc metalloprotease [Actinomadura gamaensis]|uniref:Zinc metalloprotease n=1 Tax=Actinomadura gamaensis TaxID=1763541 RepID=A0ABV9U9B0_9ACTN